MIDVKEIRYNQSKASISGRRISWGVNMLRRSLSFFVLVFSGALVLASCADQGGSDCGACAQGTACRNGVCVSNFGDDTLHGDNSVLDLGETTQTDTSNPTNDVVDTEPTDTGNNNGELCSNGVDDNGNGVIDEGCACVALSTQPCWPDNRIRRRNVGACSDGVQECMQLGDFWIWGQCAGAVTPGAEVGGNGVDEDCDGVDAPPQDPLNCWASEKGVCNNGVDEDCDGLTDCYDTDCATYCAACTEYEEICSGGVDEDCDGLTDCQDPDCSSQPECDIPIPPACQPVFPYFLEIACGDGRDNDCDGRIDCDDNDCKTPGQCGCDTKENGCSDQIDNDCDGHTDCADENCETCTPGSMRWCDEPTQCYWGQQECQSDHTWGQCYENVNRPGNCSGQMYSMSCCVSANQCCQNYPDDQSSVGNCATVSSCLP